jgi:homocitrate synthase NifV
MIRDDIILEDTTLRDGEQSPGVAFDKGTKVEIFDLLVEAGVTWIEAGIAVMGGDEQEAMRLIADRCPPGVTAVAWNRGVRDDVALSLDLGFTAVHIGLPTSKLHLKQSVNRDRDWLVEQAADLIRFAKDRGAFVSISAEDIARTEIAFLQEYAGRVAEAGADRLRMSDTIGILTPEQYGERIAAVASAAPIDLMCHTHNDFGLATANTIAGLNNGARYFHVTVNAIGERAGMSDIAQVVFALKKLYDRDLGIDGVGLKKLSRRVAAATGHPPPPWHPVVGENVFAHESGIHVKGMLNDTRAFEPIPPDEVGAQRSYVLGKHSGRANIRFALQERGIEPDDGKLAACLEQIRAEAINRGGAVPGERLEQIYRSLS